MRHNSLLLAVLAALCIALLVQASPTRGRTSPSRPPSRPPSQPASPARPPSKPIGVPTKPPKTKPVTHPAAPPAHGSGPSTSTSGQQTAASLTELLTSKAKCNTHTTCEECAAATKEVKVTVPGEGGSRKGSTKVNARCAWQQATSAPQGKCIGIEATTRPLSPSLHLIANKNQCAALEQAIIAHQEQLLKGKQKARAVQLWNAMESHVLGTAQSQNADSGTHVASGWLFKHKTDKLTVEKATQLAQSTETPAKTLWLDNVNDPAKYPGPYYTHQDVATMCETALLALIETVHEETIERGSQHSSSQHSSTGSTHSAADDTIKIPVQKRAFSVKSPRTHNNVCITIAPQKTDADYSCFPSNTKLLLHPMSTSTQHIYAPPPGPPPQTQQYAPPPGPPPTRPSLEPVPIQSRSLLPVDDAPFDLQELSRQGWTSLSLKSVYPELYDAYTELFAQSRRFFSSPNDDRQKYHIPAAMQTSEEGYSVVEGEKLLITLRRTSHCPPELLPATERAWNLTGAWLADKLRLVARSLALPEDAFEQLARPCARLPKEERVATLLRLFRYDRPPSSDGPRVVSESHRDLGLLTLVVGHSPGLDAWDVDANGWKSIEDGSNGELTATLLAGQTLARLTNNLYTAGRHQVRVHPASENGEPYRFSIVFAQRGFLPAKISSAAYTTDVTGPFHYPFPEVEMRELYRAISNAHYNVNIDKDLRSQQKQKLAETGNSGRAEPEAYSEPATDAPKPRRCNIV
ncbi:hypothetical protein EXIGLDRAFT_751549 [Exidia glandulosa HHB12029]|uniref:Fe2OG dioxygenase domain-containing protein n=1 Tax=Exidia glandulosa HHB12029 TaxID=1314781 RepID=A0A165FB63_EXIGL|nr:hypothetical protein EXIGLDRAFT_751549 [Exidia glandulosa HHB12029]